MDALSPKTVTKPQGQFGGLIAIVAVAIVVVLVIAMVFHNAFSLHRLKDLVAGLETAKIQHPFTVAVLFFLTYVLITACCIPFEVPCALAGGALFGFGFGVVLASFASSVGATIAFTASRFLLSGFLKSRFSRQLDTINAGIASNGIYYLFSLRLQPVLPFNVVNVLMGLTTMKTYVFYLVSQVGMIFATLIFVNAGTQLRNIHHYSDILSPMMIGCLTALALLPLLGKWLVKALSPSGRQPARVDKT